MSRSTVWSLVYMRHVFIAAESYALTEGAGTAQVTMPGKHHPSPIVFFTQLGLYIYVKSDNAWPLPDWFSCQPREVLFCLKVLSS